MMGKEKILDSLRQKPMGADEISAMRNIKKSSVRSLISRFRKEGYVIKFQNNKYTLLDNDTLDNDISNKIIKWIEDNNQYGEIINLDYLSKQLEVPLSNIVLGISKLFSTYKVLQLTTNTIKVFKCS